MPAPAPIFPGALWAGALAYVATPITPQQGAKIAMAKLILAAAMAVNEAIEHANAANFAAAPAVPFVVGAPILGINAAADRAVRTVAAVCAAGIPEIGISGGIAIANLRGLFAIPRGATAAAAIVRAVAAADALISVFLDIGGIAIAAPPNVLAVPDVAPVVAGIMARRIWNHMMERGHLWEVTAGLAGVAADLDFIEWNRGARIATGVNKPVIEHSAFVVPPPGIGVAGGANFAATFGNILHAAEIASFNAVVLAIPGPLSGMMQVSWGKNSSDLNIDLDVSETMPGGVIAPDPAIPAISIIKANLGALEVDFFSNPDTTADAAVVSATLSEVENSHSALNGAVPTDTFMPLYKTTAAPATAAAPQPVKIIRIRLRNDATASTMFAR
jgi:hypothetical protein